MGITTISWRLMEKTLDTRAGRNLICNRAIPQIYWKEVKEFSPKWLRSTADIPLPVFGSTRLLIQLEQQVTRIDFLVVESLVVDILLGTAFNIKNIKSRYPKCVVAVPTGSCPVDSETQPNATPQANTDECPEKQVDKMQEPLPCGVAKRNKIPRLSEPLISVRTSWRSLQPVSTHNKLTQKGVALAAQGIIDVMPGRLLVIKIANWPKEPMTVPKRMVVEQCSALSSVMVSSLKEPINAVQLYKNQESKEEMMKQHYAVAREDVLKRATHWTKQVQFSEKYTKPKVGFLETMRTLTKIWDGYPETFWWRSIALIWIRLMRCLFTQNLTE